MAKLIGTAGHVDHGKTTLIQALTGIDADRLPEEKQRGMTIDIGFAYIDLPEVGRVSIVDVPGHERFLTNMLVGALGIDVALLCVSADESVMPQTREHLQILELLPVERMVVALTRADLADEDMRFLARAEVEELIEASRFKNVPIIAVSALKGEGLDELKAELTKALKTESALSSGPWYLPVDRAFSVKGHGCVVTGTLAQGSVKVGDRAFLEPGRHEVRVRAIHSHGDPLDHSERGRRTALNLSGIKVEDVHRGMALGEPGALFETNVFDAKVAWVGEAKHGQRIRVSVGADEAIGKLFLSDTEPEIAQLRLEQMIACALNQPVIIRRYSPPDLLAGGRIVVPQAKPRRKSEAATVVTAASDDEAILEIVEGQFDGVPTDEVCRVLGKTPQVLGDTFERLVREGKLRGFAGLWFGVESFEGGVERFKRALDDLHAASPTQAFVPRERVLAAARLRWTGKPLERILSQLAAEGRVEVSGTSVRDPLFRVQLSPKQRAFLDRVVLELGKQAVNTPGPHELARDLGVPHQAVEEILKLGMQAGEVVNIAEGIYYTPAQLEALKGSVREIAAGKPFPASQIRDTLGTTRKYVIPLLEYFDKVRFTTRVGDNRMVNG